MLLVLLTVSFDIKLSFIFLGTITQNRLIALEYSKESQHIDIRDMVWTGLKMKNATQCEHLTTYHKKTPEGHMLYNFWP